MALLFPSHFAFAPSSAGLLEELMDLSAAPISRPTVYVPSPAWGCSLQGCGRTAAHPAWPPPGARLQLRQPRLAPPVEPEVLTTRTEDGVLARCPLGPSFARGDVRLRLDSSGSALTITAFHPSTETFWPERPVAYRRTLELAGHIDAAGIRARLEGGVLSIFFPFRRRPQPRPSYSWVLVERSPAPAPCRQAPSPAPPARYVPSPSRTGAVPVAQRGPAAQQQAAPRPTESATWTGFVRPQPAPLTRCQGLQHTAQRPGPVVTQGPRQPAQQQQSQSRPRIIPVLGPEPERPEPQRHTQAAGPVEPAVIQETTAQAATSDDHGEAQAGPAAAPQPAAADPSAAAPQPSAEEERAAAAAEPSAAPSASKGKARASRKHAAAWERREAARRAAERIAAGSTSDSDWEQADGSVTDCSLDD